MSENKGKPRGKPFQKGNKLANGRPRVSEEQKEVMKLTRTKFNTITMKYLNYNRAELEKIARHPETPAIDMMVISVMVKAIKQGDEKKLNWFLEQLFGKLKENRSVDVNMSGSVDMVRKVDMSQLSDDELANMENMLAKC